jgi:hypothetical protein
MTLNNRWCTHASADLYVADVNGDKRSDLVCHDRANGHKWVALANSQGDVPAQTWEAPLGWCFHPAADLRVMDVTGDGRADLVCHDKTNGWKWVAKNDGSSSPWKRGTTFEGPYGRYCAHAGAELLLSRVLPGSYGRSLLCHDRNDGRKWVSWWPPL